MIAAQEGWQDDAIRDFKKSLSIRKNYVTALLNLGNLYRRQGNFSGARSNSNLKTPKRTVVWDAAGPRGGFLRRCRAFGKNRSAPSELSRSTGYPGVLLTRQNRTSEAETKSKSCIAIAPNYDQAHLNLARLHMLRREKEKAREILLDLLKLQPRHKLAQQALEMLD